MAYNTLYDYYAAQGKALPSYNSADRIALAAKAGITSGYVGSAEQNTQIVNYLNKLSTPTAIPTAPSTPSSSFNFSPTGTQAPTQVNDLTKTSTPQTILPTAEELAAQQKAQNLAKLAQQEEARKAQVKSAAESLKTSGAGTTSINQFLSGLSAEDRSMVSGMFGSNVLPGATSTPSNVQKTTVSGTGISSSGSVSPEVQASIDAINASIKNLQSTANKYGVSLSEIKTPSNIPDIVNAPTTKGEVTLPNLPEKTGTTTASNLIPSLQASVNTAKANLDTTYKTQIADLNKKIEESNKKLSDLNTLKIEGAITNVETLSQPFRQALEESERTRLYITKNFEANQKLTDELDTLLTDGNALIAQQKGVTGLSSIRDPRINQTISDVTARAGVIKAVIDARNGQISQAYTMIDRTEAAIAEDRTDKINYYNTLLDYYGNLKTEEKTKLAGFTSEKKAILEKQVASLEKELSDAQETAKMIKDAMLDPDTALTFASAGITLNDSPEQVNAKLAQYGYSQEVKTTSEKMALDGASFLAPGQSAPAGSQIFTTVDSLGKTKTWYKPTSSTKSTDPLKTDDYSYAKNIIDVNPNASYDELFAGILEHTKLTETESRAILSEKGIKKTGTTKAEIYLTPQNINDIAKGLVSSYGKDGALEAITTTGKVNITDESGNSKQITLSTDQIDSINSAINTSSGTSESSWRNLWGLI